MHRSEAAQLRKLYRREALTGWTFVLPLMVFLVAFVLVPVAGTVVSSFFRDVTFLPGNEVVGLRNYARMLSDSAFWQTVRFTHLFIAASVPLELGLGLMFALLLNARIPLRGLVRACVLIPWAIPAAVSARTWELIYNYSYGLANFLVLKTHLAQEPVHWLGTSTAAFAAVVVADVWKTTPFVAVILLASLQTIPADLHRQAKVDRANFLQAFCRITLPLIRPGIVAALLFRTIDALRVFDLVYVLTGGGPGGATTSMSLYAYTHYAGGDFGYGSTASVLLFALALGLSILYVKVGRFRAEAT
jgi:multiple sugar transport system permease protein